MPPHDPLLPLWAMELLAHVFLWAWLFCMGATVGSFLNVVVYRLPRGLNLAYPGSYCPHCGHSIRLQDNIPILSWLNLRGRCRDCGGRISSRYFFVELTAAIAFWMVLLGDYYLPSGALGFHTRHILTARDGVPFWCMYFLHVGLVTTLIAAALLLSDSVLPPALFVPIIVVGFVLPIVWPSIRSIPAAAYPNDYVWWAGLCDGIAGIALGVVAAMIIRAVLNSTRYATTTTIAIACATAIVVGWQRAIYMVPVAVVCLHLAAAILRRRLLTHTATGTTPVPPPESTEQIPAPPEAPTL